MNVDYNFFKVSDGQSLAYKKWLKVDNPVGIIILIHGMAEHIERYDELANICNQNGFLVYGVDQRGHGKTSGRKGFFSNKNGHNRIILDQEEFYNFIKNDNTTLPISYIAHSMGSFVLRKILSRNNVKIKSAIISGTGFEPALKSFFAVQLAKIISIIKGKTTEAHFIDSFVNGPFARSIQNPVTKFDWLSRDNGEVSKYVNDTNCGFICTNQFYTDFFKIISYTCNNKSIKKIDKKLPILLLSGDNDPVGGNLASGVKKLESLYIKNNLDVSCIINEGGRHENINETNREEVFDHFIKFLQKVN